MSKDLMTAVSKLPAHLRKHVNMEAFEEFSGGVTSGFPILSYRGKSWRIRSGGTEETYLNEEGEAVQSVELVLIKSNKLPSKTYYDKKYTEGDQTTPKCWSANGVKPDSEVEEPVSKSCSTCPMNVWGSKITEQGNKTRACADVRRCAVVFRHDIEAVVSGEKKLADIPTILLRIPPASLNPLKDFVEKTLQPRGILPFMVYTRVGFDTEVAYPKLTFRAVGFAEEADMDAIMEIREGDSVKRILNESIEVAGGTTDDDDDTEEAEVSAPSKAKSAAPPAPKKKSAVEAEEMTFPDFGDDDDEEEAPRPAATESAAMDEDEDDEDDAPPPPPKKAPAAKKKKVSKPAKVAAPTGSVVDNFDSLLDSILD